MTKDKSKIGIVVQRCHESIVGGSEALAWRYATLLRDATDGAAEDVDHRPRTPDGTARRRYEVEVLTTTALDTAVWRNALPAGRETRDGVCIRRFPVTTGRSEYWGELHARLLRDSRTAGASATDTDSIRPPWSVSLQEEFIRQQGPYSEPLLKFLRERHADYRVIIFVTYLYPTSYFGLLHVPPRTALFAPTLHDEAPAYLSVYQHAARRAGEIVWLTDAEARVGAKLWGELPGRVVGMDIDTRPREPDASATPYLLYCGRIDPNKGCLELFDHFIKFKERGASDLRLVLVGADDIPVPVHPAIEFRGFVPHEEKFRLMAGALALAMPSGNESFSIVTLEAMAQSTPALGSDKSEVITDHITRGGSGLIYGDGESFAAALRTLLTNDEARREMGARGREYVTANYDADSIRRKLVAVIEDRAVGEAMSDTTRATAQGDAADNSITHGGSIGERSSDFRTSPPLMLPAGWSAEELRDLLSSVQVVDGPALELHNYANSDFRRFVYTLSLVPDTPAMRVLELGGNPYFTTTLLRKFRDARVEVSNFFGSPEDAGARSGVQDVIVHKTGELIPIRFKEFNIERDRFPYADDSFDAVLCCEIIEHLLLDPVHALTEIRRVLAPGGALVLTTPNVARLENVCKLVEGVNIYDPYSGYGPYGRHNREYTKHDLHRLLTVNGFTIEELFTADVHTDYALASRARVNVEPLVRHREEDLGQYIFCRSRIGAEAKGVAPARPAWLYRSMSDSA